MSGKLLMLCPYWPPMGGPGVQRAVKLAKYLPEFGYTPLVVTRRAAEIEDESLVADTAGIAVRTTAHIPFQRLGGAAGGATTSRISGLKRVRDWLQLPDHAVSWAPFAYRTAASWARAENPVAIFTTSPYHSVHLTGLALKSRLHLPWIADFRDPWVGDKFTNYPTATHARINAALEKRVIAAADSITVISAAMARDFRERYPDNASKISIVHNGFDPADFPTAPALATQPPYIIRHMGTFYPDRKPDAFLAGLAAFKNNSPAAAADIRVEFYGKHHGDVEARLRALTHELGLTSQVAFFDYVPHEKAVALQQSSHALLLIPGPGETTVTGKIFEYLATGRPILAMAPFPSGIDEILGDLGPNPLRIAENAEAVAAALQVWATAVRNGKAQSLVYPADQAMRYTRQAAAEKFAKLAANCANRV